MCRAFAPTTSATAARSLFPAITTIFREGLEKLCRYLVRPAIAASRLELVEKPVGNKTIRIWLKSEWQRGIKSVVVSKKDLLIKALAQIPLPFRRQIIYHGCFAGNSNARAGGAGWRQTQRTAEKEEVRRQGGKDGTAGKHENALARRALKMFRLTHPLGVLPRPPLHRSKYSRAAGLPAAHARSSRRSKSLLKLNDFCGICNFGRTPMRGDRYCQFLAARNWQYLSPPVHGPPEDFDIEEFERQADWDDFYESEELMKAHAENWAA